MRVLNESEYAILELLAIQPLANVPANQLSIVEKLAKQGVIGRQDDHWYLTRVGLILAGRTLH